MSADKQAAGGVTRADRLRVARYLRSAARSPKRHPDTVAAMLRVADSLAASADGGSDV